MFESFCTHTNTKHAILHFDTPKIPRMMAYEGEPHRRSPHTDFEKMSFARRTSKFSKITLKKKPSLVINGDFSTDFETFFERGQQTHKRNTLTWNIKKNCRLSKKQFKDIFKNLLARLGNKDYEEEDEVNNKWKNWEKSHIMSWFKMCLFFPVLSRILFTLLEAK